MRWILLAALVVGCGSSAAGERLAVDADPPSDASADTSATGAAGAGGAAGSASGGATGAAGAPVAPGCAIPETAITATAGPTQIVPEGSDCTVPSFPGPDYPAISQGQVAGGVPNASKWTLKSYVIVPSGSQCAATIEFTCPGCAGNYQTGTRGPCDAFMEVQLTVAAQ